MRRTGGRAPGPPRAIPPLPPVHATLPFGGRRFPLPPPPWTSHGRLSDGDEPALLPAEAARLAAFQELLASKGDGFRLDRFWTAAPAALSGRPRPPRAPTAFAFLSANGHLLWRQPRSESSSQAWLMRPQSRPPRTAAPLPLHPALAPETHRRLPPAASLEWAAGPRGGALERDEPVVLARCPSAAAPGWGQRERPPLAFPASTPVSEALALLEAAWGRRVALPGAESLLAPDSAPVRALVGGAPPWGGEPPAASLGGAGLLPGPAPASGRENPALAPD